MTTTNTSKLNRLTVGMQLIYNGNQLFTVDDELVDEFQSGDHLVFVPGFDRPIVIPSNSIQQVDVEIQHAMDGFYSLGRVSSDAINGFYDAFSNHLMDDDIWSKIQHVNDLDVADAKAKGRSITRLVADDKCRNNMAAGLLDFKNQAVERVSAISDIHHDGWSVDLLKSPLGVVGFVFEGRPNVIADATGVLKSGNTVVFRVGRDALRTAKAIVQEALYPALDIVGISRNVIRLIESPERSTAWALFSNSKLNLAVARGSGEAVRMLGGIAQQYGIPVSLHGTGGAWMMTNDSTDLNRLHDAIVGSLDRKVCNTLNTICLLKSGVEAQLPVVLNALKVAGENLGQLFKVHVESGSVDYFSELDFNEKVTIERANGVVVESQFEQIEERFLGTEWEWEKTPEVTIVIVNSLNDSIRLFNQYSPQFVASLITQSQIELIDFFGQVNAPFVGNGMTRWVDGQYALNSPELGLSNWESGRFLARSAILSGDSVYTTRLKMNQI
ncbi:MAG: glutamate-5-semialdehyde dehydrogenase, partial [Candidatus Margulisiibacteriota bacterium]